MRKIEALTNIFLKDHNECAQLIFAKVFDITKTGGTWLANEDKQFNNKMQIKLQGEVRYPAV